jgi:hypothetical protein
VAIVDVQPGDRVAVALEGAIKIVVGGVIPDRVPAVNGLAAFSSVLVGRPVGGQIDVRHQFVAVVGISLCLSDAVEVLRRLDVDGRRGRRRGRRQGRR